MHFILETQERNTYIYREQLQRNAREGNYYLRVSIQDLLNFDELLANHLRDNPSQALPTFEKGVATVYRTHYH